MTDYETTPLQIDGFRRLLMHLPDTADLGLIILKGHLLLEEQLTIIIEERMKRPSAIELQKPNWIFDHVLSLTEALCGGEVDDDVWKCLRKINKIRNNMVHKLEPKGLEDQVRDLNDSWPSGLPNENPQAFLFMTLASIFVVVSGLVRQPSQEVIRLVQSDDKSL